MFQIIHHSLIMPLQYQGSLKRFNKMNEVKVLDGLFQQQSSRSSVVMKKKIDSFTKVKGVYLISDRYTFLLFISFLSFCYVTM